MYQFYSEAFLFALMWIVGGQNTARTTPRTPALVMRACGPGDSWIRTEVLVLSPRGELARIEFEERQLKKLAAGTKIGPNDAEFGENLAVPLRLKDGRALFLCAVTQPCKAVEGRLEISAYRFGERFSGTLTWGTDSQAVFSATAWLEDLPECV